MGALGEVGYAKHWLKYEKEGEKSGSSSNPLLRMQEQTSRNGKEGREQR